MNVDHDIASSPQGGQTRILITQARKVPVCSNVSGVKSSSTGQKQPPRPLIERSGACSRQRGAQDEEISQRIGWDRFTACGVWRAGGDSVTRSSPLLAALDYLQEISMHSHSVMTA